MLNLAIFISGRIKFYNKCLIPIIQHLKSLNKYNIRIFFSINSNQPCNEVIECFKDILGYYEFKPFFYEKDWLENRLKNNRKYLGSYNQLSCFYNDLNNFNLIEKYEKDNNIEFDIICKLRSDIIFRNLNQVNFHKDDSKELILNNINLAYTIRAYNMSPPLISDANCFGNKKSMKIYCSTYNFIKNMDIKLNGLYNRTFEPYLNESLYNCLIYGDGLLNMLINSSPYTREEFIDIFNHKYSEQDKKFIRKDYDWKYIIIRGDDTITDYVPPKNVIINNEKYIWKAGWTGLLHENYINETNSFI